MKNLLFILIVAFLSSCNKEDCTPNSSLEGKWKQVSTPSQQLLNIEVEFKNGEGVITRVDANTYGVKVGNVAWKEITQESPSVFGGLVLISSAASQSYQANWKISILAGGQELAFTRPGNATDVYQRWVRM